MKKRFYTLILLCLAGVTSATGTAWTAEPADASIGNTLKPNKIGNVSVRGQFSDYPTTGAKVYVIPIRSEINRAMAFEFHRTTKMALAGNADAVILDIYTPGGDLGSMIQIRDAALEFDCPVFSYVNPDAISAGAMIALAADVIVMSEISSIGDAYPITGSGQQVGGGSERVEEKILTFTRSQLRKTAQAKGHDPALAQRMTDPDVAIDAYPGLLEPGQLLTLTQDEATSVGLAAFIAEDIDDLLEKAGYANWTIHRPTLSWSEKLAGFLVHPAVSSVLMLVALAAFYMEFKTPGVGVPAAVGTLAIGLFFWGGMLADLSSYWEPVVFIIGMLLIAAEVFVIPGFGVAGIVGLLCVFGSLISSMTQLPATTFDPVNLEVLWEPFLAVASAFLLSVPVFMVMAHYLPDLPLVGGLVLNPDNTDLARAEDEIRAAPPKWAGKVGVTITNLRPVGVALFEGERVDVMTLGDYIEEGVKVRAVREHGNEVVVARAEAQSDPRDDRRIL